MFASVVAFCWFSFAIPITWDCSFLCDLDRVNTRMYDAMLAKDFFLKKLFLRIGIIVVLLLGNP